MWLNFNGSWYKSYCNWKPNIIESLLTWLAWLTTTENYSKN